MSFPLPAGRPAIMGVLNVTPDSFSDGGEHIGFESALIAARSMASEGAEIIDVGGESTRPGALPVSTEDELDRVLPVVRALVSEGIAVSIDTSKPEVAELCLAAGAVVLNDVTGLRDPAMRRIAAKHGCQVCLMHMKGEPRTMQADPQYDDVVGEVFSTLTSLANEAERAGVDRANIWIDPGIGFGKTLDHNLTLLGSLDRFVASGYPVLIGVSRKSFLGRILDEPDPKARWAGSLAVQVLAQIKGVRVLRVHDVKPTRQSADVVAAIQASQD